MTGGSYRAGEVTLLFTDLTGVISPVGMDEVVDRARRTAGAGHRGVVPMEEPPSPRAMALFGELLAAGAGRVALLGCVLARRIAASCAAERRAGGEVVLASIARAGTPVGVILARLLRERYRTRCAHYSVSLVPGLGLDRAALAYITERHPPGAVRFVDAWSGKGGIARVLTGELTTAGEALGVRVSTELALLSDPGQASSLAGTRTDVLVPSAVLNAPVSGGFSRSFVPEGLGAGEFHAAIGYPELSSYDVSREFVEAICAAAERIAEADVTAALAASSEAPCPPRASGWGFAEALAVEFDTPNMLNFVKPGLNETCRTLVARRPAVVLLDPDKPSPAQTAIRELATEAGVPLRNRAMPYAAVGIAEG
jgi:hypothetical protein